MEPIYVGDLLPSIASYKKIKSKKVIIVPIKDKFSLSKLNNKSGWDKAQPMP